MDKVKEKYASHTLMGVLAAFLLLIALAVKHIITNFAAAVLCIMLITLTFFMRSVQRYRKKGETI